MNWLLIVYLLVLVFLAFKRDRFADSTPLRPAWMAFALIPISWCLFALIRAGNFRDARDLALIEIWANGIEALLLGVSMLFLTGLLAPHPWSNRTAPPPPPPSTP